MLPNIAFTFKEEHVPDPENCWPGQGPSKGAEKPLRHVQNWLHFLPLLPNQIKVKKFKKKNKCIVELPSVGKLGEPPSWAGQRGCLRRAAIAAYRDCSSHWGICDTRSLGTRRPVLLAYASAGRQPRVLVLGSTQFQGPKPNKNYIIIFLYMICLYLTEKALRTVKSSCWPTPSSLQNISWCGNCLFRSCKKSQFISTLFYCLELYLFDVIKALGVTRLLG